MIGSSVSDLEVGDRLGPVDHHLSPFLVHEYAHAVEDGSERHQGSRSLIVPPTMVHTHKIRLLDQACPGGAGPSARLHVVYDATHRACIPADRTLAVSGVVSDRYQRRGRDHLVLELEVRDKATGQVYTTYRDTSVLSYRPHG